jgi:hypothetical protein
MFEEKAMCDESISKKEPAGRVKGRKLHFKSILKILLVVLPIVIPILISVKSCQISESARDIAQQASKLSEDSNRIAREALDNSKQQFIQINRPYILVSPKKFDDGLYWRLFLENKNVVKRLKYQIKNVGNVIATNLSLPDIMKIEVESRKQNDGMVITYEKPSNVTIGPGDSFTLNFTIKSTYATTQDARRNMEFYTSERYEGDTIQVSISYHNDLEPTKKYRTVVVNRIHNDTAHILKSEMLIIDKRK